MKNIHICLVFIIVFFSLFANVHGNDQFNEYVKQQIQEQIFSQDDVCEHVDGIIKKYLSLNLQVFYEDKSACVQKCLIFGKKKNSHSDVVFTFDAGTEKIYKIIEETTDKEGYKNTVTVVYDKKRNFSYSEDTNTCFIYDSFLEIKDFLTKYIDINSYSCECINLKKELKTCCNIIYDEESGACLYLGTKKSNINIIKLLLDLMF